MKVVHVDSSVTTWLTIHRKVDETSRHDAVREKAAGNDTVPISVCRGMCAVLSAVALFLRCGYLLTQL